MDLLDQYLSLQQQLYAYFDYVEDWRILPMDDQRAAFWKLEGMGPGVVKFAATEAGLADEESQEYYENAIYTQRHLPRWVYRGEEYTMIVVDTHTDGNQLLQIFTNANERP